MHRRTFLRTGLTAGVVVGLAGCASNTNEPESDPTTPTKDTATTTEEATPTENEETADDDPDIDRPDNYRWDMQPGRNEELRNELGQYVDGGVGPIVEDHPAFKYSTDSERDDHEIDFEALKLFRDAQYDILRENNPSTPWEHYVEAFVNDDIEQEAKTDGFMRYDVDDSHTYTSEAWLNADSFEQSLDLAHGLLASMIPLRTAGLAEQAAILREVYQRHQDYEAPLAWETNMGVSIGDGYRAKITGLMYTPEDDKMRAFDWPAGDRVRTEESRRWHSEIQEWPIFNEDNDTFHPLLFHTDEWDRQNPGFMAAKDEAVATITGIGTNEYLEFKNTADGIVNNITITTSALKQLTRTLLEYNEAASDVAEFGDIRDLANFAVGQYIQDPSINGILDTAGPDGEYDEYFQEGFSFYEVADESIVKAVRQDRNGQYDNFGQSYDKLA
jgi:hypothetical protein